jgi:hypothetical protein
VLEDRIPRLLHQVIAAIPSQWYIRMTSICYMLRLLWRLEAIRTLVDVLDIRMRDLVGSRQGILSVVAGTYWRIPILSALIHSISPRPILLSGRASMGKCCVRHNRRDEVLAKITISHLERKC